MNNRVATLTVDRGLPLERLDSYLRSVFPVVSRGTLQRLIEEGHVRVNGRLVKATYAPRQADLIEIEWPDAKPADAAPEAIPLDVLYEDEDVVVVNKPAGLVVHPAVGNEEHTLVNALLHHCKGKLSGIGGVARPGIVHRLDKDTSGCMVSAKNDATHTALAEQFEQRTVHKRYHAIVCGMVVRESGEIRAPIARHPSHRKRMTVREDQGRAARTSYHVVERLCASTLVEAVLHTGRTHQIRVHFQHIGFPLVGDMTYGKAENARLLKETGYAAPRQMLHAAVLRFKHPSTGEPVAVEAPWPADFAATLEALRSGHEPV